MPGARGLLLCLLLVAAAGGARAGEEDKTYACTFTEGASWSYEAGAFQSKLPEALSFKITDVDLEGQTARLVTGDKTGPLKIVRAINATHFLEVVNEGFLNLTTVYDTDPSTGLHPAVHSRHFGLIGQPVFAQYAGTCTSR